jgi:peptidoglycan/LPS O-acetylase OafA/YrhL
LETETRSTGRSEPLCQKSLYPCNWSQFTDWLQQILIFVNVFDWSLYAGSIELDRHLWTIPVEYRCSMVLFLTHIMVARMPPRLRLSVLTGLIAWGVSWNRWELCPFWAGMIIAELDIIRIDRAANDSIPMNLASNTPDLEKDQNREVPSTHRPARSHFTTAYWIIWVLSLFLLSYPDAAGHATPGYITLTSLIPASFTQMHRFWPTIGAILIVWSSCHLGLLRDRIFCSRPIQYLGKISFPLYVMHGPIIHTLGYLVCISLITFFLDYSLTSI